jgi:CubicO group peptidase (beta-lactamase class C family)
MPTLEHRLERVAQAALEVVFPACSLVVRHRGQVKFERAWGTIDPQTRQIPCHIDTLFDLASLTKLFTVTAFLSIAAAQHVPLDDPLVSVIPEFGAFGARGLDGGVDPHSKQPYPVMDFVRDVMVDPSQVTFQHLLTHTSGLAAWRPVYAVAGDTPPPPDQIDPLSPPMRWARALAYLCTTPFVAQPGKQLLYSDLGLMLLGEATARLSAQPLQTVIEHVLAPFSTPDSPVFRPVDHGVKRDQIAPTEFDVTWRKRRIWGEVHDENACGVGGVAGHAGLFGTAQGMAAFGQWWLGQLESELWAADAVREYVVSGNERRGLGWMLKSPANASAGDLFSTDSFGHTGFTGTSLWVDPHAQTVVALLTNSVYGGREKGGTHEFRRAVHHEVAESLI